MTVRSEPASRSIKKQIVAWALWDWGSAAFNAVVTTFVFTVYLTSAHGFGDTNFVSEMLGWALGISGLLVALLAPITASRSDGSGRRKFWLGINTGVVVVSIALLYFVAPTPQLLWLGLGLLAVGTLFYELAYVNYNSILLQISNPTNIGRVSGFGWAAGYFGGIVLLLILLVGFIFPDVGWFGVTSENGLNIRVAMVVAAAWFAVSAIPVLVAVPEVRATRAPGARLGLFASYAKLFADIRKLWREDRNLVWFLLSSAVFRDGLTGVFTFGGVLAAAVFGFSSTEVVLFAIAGNVIAGIATLLFSVLDDKFGPKPVIIGSLTILSTAGLLLFIMHDSGKLAFWVIGLILAAFVGAPQSASRTYLSRMIPAGREGEIFGLYATTGRAAVFLAPTAFALAIRLTGETVSGILGLVAVLLLGLLLLLPVARPPLAGRPASDSVS